MKNKDILTFREALNEVDYIRNKTFAYAVFRNKDILDKEIETINKLKREPHPDYINFENERTLLCRTHCEKDENGNPQLQYNPDGTQSFKIIDMAKFNDEYQILAKKYEDVLKDMQDAKKDFDEFMEKESDVELKKVRLEDLPDDISANFLEKIKFMLE
ncbi:MAG: hypothetical protein HPY57_14515 [Ignavibacteria bacterium]|nr:hypothetical protein [Ignavibacteria bacterium]